MRTMYTIVSFMIGVTAIALGQGVAHAGDWSSWQKMNDVPLSFRYVQVNSDTCALAFRNDSGTRILGGKLQYIHDGRVDNDILPSLNPGQKLGGWSAFSFDGNCRNAQVRVYDLQLQQ